MAFRKIAVAEESVREAELCAHAEKDRHRKECCLAVMANNKAKVSASVY